MNCRFSCKIKIEKNTNILTESVMNCFLQFYGKDSCVFIGLVTFRAWCDLL